MKEQITYSTFQKSDFESLLKMGLKLWTDYGESKLAEQLERVCSLNNQKILIAKNSKDIAIGFSIFSIREDYVEGADKTPTGYLEGIYVEPQFRKNGIAKRFLQMGEQWLKTKNCTQIGSDTWLTDIESRKFHKKIGFWEEDELVHFLKNIE
ncbi:GNAT family N-acetyltransferase [Cyclobacterium xiamenense]|uniref:GNAT family N-acetyltransferase n=1 Tax=Cyclobacterium xiamenense TaxID=1297121 RepID=UPI0035CF2001